MSKRSLKWTAGAIASYKATGEQMKARGYKAMREIQDPDCETVLTFWGSASGTVIQQTWTQLGDTVLWRAMVDLDEACSQQRSPVGEPEQTREAKGKS